MLGLTFNFYSVYSSWCIFLRANMCGRKCFVSEFKLCLMGHAWPIKLIYSAYSQKHFASQMSYSDWDRRRNLFPATVFLGCWVVVHA